MKRIIVSLTILSVLGFFFSLSLVARTGGGDNKAFYEPKSKDKVMEEIKKKRKAQKAKAEKATEEIEERQKKEKEKKEEQKRTLKTDMKGVFPPNSPEDFKKEFHFPPIPQYATSTCWSFSATSYYESEIFRLTGKKLKLSEMWTPYFEMIEKCRRYIRKRGDSYVAGGGESNSITRIWKKYGVVPAEAYCGLLNKTDKHDHEPMMDEIESYLEYIKTSELWDEEHNLKHVRLIMDKYMGRPPEKFTYNGKTMTPKEFLKNETGLNLDDYYSLMSTSYFPFYTYREFMVPDNWWFSKEYINLPLEVWYGVIKKSIQSGYTLIIGGDVSEPGKLGMKDIIFIPSFDIPEKYINQDSREYRIYNESTEDDHGIHLVGFKRYKGKDWFLIKDSGRSARYGKHKGYYFFRGDFIKLKMMTYTAHKDVLKEILPKLKK